MRRCLFLASLAEGYTAPNPMVGAVLVHGDRVIGEGYHRAYGSAHAEVNCINSVSEADRELIPQSTLYVSLEPCAHHGKTPPCAELITKHGISSVVIGCRDPFPKVNGKGVDLLREAGVHVIENVLKDECRALNKRFFCFHEKGRPYIVLKWAQTSDGFISTANRAPFRISNPFTDRLVHRLRAREQGIFVGPGTLLSDDPLLNVRYFPGTNPVRISFDDRAALPPDLHFFTEKSDYGLLEPGVKDIPAGLAAFCRVRGIISVLVEGGASVLSSFVRARDEQPELFDEVLIITNIEQTAGEGIPAPVLPGEMQQRRLFNNIVSGGGKVSFNTLF